MSTWGSYNGQSIYRNEAEPQASLRGASIAPTRSNEGKVARAFVDKTNVLVFNSELFARMVMAYGGQGMQDRTLDIAKAFIRALADQYDVGIVNDATVDAKRLLDTMAVYKM